MISQFCQIVIDCYWNVYRLFQDGIKLVLDVKPLVSFIIKDYAISLTNSTQITPCSELHYTFVDWK